MDCDDGINEGDEMKTTNDPSSDFDLTNAFSNMQTNEKDDLINNFSSITNMTAYTTARFFLEMNNWNLQLAVGCYFDFLATQANPLNSPMPSMKIIREETVGLGESITTNTIFTQSWLLENNGTVAWPHGCYLKLVSEINNDEKMYVEPISPNDNTIVIINLSSPPEVGQFRNQFCLCTPQGTTFGPIIWSIVDVSDSGTLALTQQLTKAMQISAPQLQQQPPPLQGCDENAMQSDYMSSNNTCNVLVPHCSNNFLADNSVNNMSTIPFPAQNPNVPQNSPNLDEEMAVNTHNI